MEDPPTPSGELKWDTANEGTPRACTPPSGTRRGSSLWEDNLARLSPFCLWPLEGRTRVQWNVNWQRFGISHYRWVLVNIMLISDLSSCCSVHEMSDWKRWMKCAPVSLALLCTHTCLTSFCSHLWRPLWLTGVNLLWPSSHLFIHLLPAARLCLEPRDTPCHAAFCTSPLPSAGPPPYISQFSPCAISVGLTLTAVHQTPTSSLPVFPLS